MAAKEYLDVLAPAKINLALAITGQREDGYHNLQTVFQTVSLYDYVKVQLLKGDGISCNCGEYSGRQNLAYQAAPLFLTELVQKISTPIPGIKIDIVKNIPAQAGLGGGSSNAASVLKALNNLLSNPFSSDELLAIAKRCGSDTAFCLLEGTYWGEGIGTTLEKLPDIPQLNIILVKPEQGVNTGEAYQQFAKYGVPAFLDKEKWVAAIQSGEIDQLYRMLYNSLEPVSVRLVPEIGRIKNILIEEGCPGALMSGSGSTVFGILQNREHVVPVKRRLINEGFNKVWHVKTIGPA